MSDEYINSDEATVDITIVDDTEIVVRCSCPNCGVVNYVPHELFYPQDVGEGEYYKACSVLCDNCQTPLKVIFPEVL